MNFRTGKGLPFLIFLSTANWSLKRDQQKNSLFLIKGAASIFLLWWQLNWYFYFLLCYKLEEKTPLQLNFSKESLVTGNLFCLYFPSSLDIGCWLTPKFFVFKNNWKIVNWPLVINLTKSRNPWTFAKSYETQEMARFWLNSLVEEDEKGTCTTLAHHITDQLGKPRPLLQFRSQLYREMMMSLDLMIMVQELHRGGCLLCHAGDLVEPELLIVSAVPPPAWHICPFTPPQLQCHCPCRLQPLCLVCCGCHYFGWACGTDRL